MPPPVGEVAQDAQADCDGEGNRPAQLTERISYASILPPAGRMGQRGLLSAVFGKETRSFLYFCMTCMVCMVCMVFYTLYGLNVLHDLHGLHDSPERRLPANHAQPKNHANHAFHSFPLKRGTAWHFCDTLKKPPRFTPQGFRLREAGIYLFSQAVSSQLSSAQVSLTSVFGMGTGGASPSSTPAVRNISISLRCCFPGRLSYFVFEGRAFRTE